MRTDNSPEHNGFAIVRNGEARLEHRFRLFDDESWILCDDLVVVLFDTLRVRLDMASKHQLERTH